MLQISVFHVAYRSAVDISANMLPSGPMYIETTSFIIVHVVSKILASYAKCHSVLIECTSLTEFLAHLKNHILQKLTIS